MKWFTIIATIVFSFSAQAYRTNVKAPRFQKTKRIYVAKTSIDEALNFKIKTQSNGRSLASTSSKTKTSLPYWKVDTRKANKIKLP